MLRVGGPQPRLAVRADAQRYHTSFIVAAAAVFFSFFFRPRPLPLSLTPPPPPLLPKTAARHAYAIATGVVLLAYPFGSGVANLAVPAVTTYALLAQLPAFAGTLAWCLDFAFLLWCHVAGASGGAWKEGRVDYTGALMILTLKCIAAAVSRQDGATARPGLGPYAVAHARRAAPTPLEWASYCLSCGGLLSGPFFELGDYLDYVNRVGAWEPPGAGGSGGAARGRPPPPRLPHLRAAALASLLRLCKAVACAAAYFLLSPRFGPSLLEGSSGALFAAPLASRFALLWAAGVTDRAKYYAVWAIAEAGLIAAGFSYAPPPAAAGAEEAAEERPDASAAHNGGGDSTAAAARKKTKNPAPSFERFTNARILRVELASSAAELPLSWNICTGRFLRHYVYERLTRGGRGGLRTLLATQGVAGLWHGTFPGYALFFLSSAFMFESSKALYRYEKYSWPRWVASCPPWKAVKWAFVAACLNYSSSAFIILDLAPSLRVWRAVHFLPSFVMAAIVVVAKVVPPRRGRRRVAAASATGVAEATGAGAAAAVGATAGASQPAGRAKAE